MELAPFPAKHVAWFSCKKIPQVSCRQGKIDHNRAKPRIQQRNLNTNYSNEGMKFRWKDERRSSGEGNEVIRQEKTPGTGQARDDWLGKTPQGKD